MKKIEKGAYVLNKLDKKIYEYVEYRTMSFSHVLLVEDKEKISFFKTTTELLVDDNDIIVDFNEMIQFLNNVIKEKEKENKKYRRDIEKPLDKGKGLALKNTLTTDIYNINRTMTRNKLSIDEEYSLNKELKEKEFELHILNLRLSHSLYVDYANLEIEKNNKIIENCKRSISFVKKITRETTKKKKERVMNEMIIDLEKIIIGDVCHYRIVNEDDFVVCNDLFSIVNFNNDPVAVIVFSTMVDNGDYNYDDEYEPNYCEEYSYRRIYFSPLTGKKIVFNILKEIDETKRFYEMEKIIDKYRNRKRFSKDEKLALNRAKGIIKEINNGLLPIIDDCN